MRTKTFARGLKDEYRVVCQVCRDTGEFADSPFISEINAVILDGQDAPVGKFMGYVIHLVEMADADEHPALHCDDHSSHLVELYCELLAEDKALFEQSIGLDGDLLVLHRLEIVPEHRGKHLGLACCAATMALFSDECAYAAMKPFPLQYEGKGKGNGREFRADQGKLIRYYKPLGFIPASGSRAYYYRKVDQEILGFDHRGWKKIAKVTLPAVPGTTKK